jgi:hypothetical protein
VCQTAARIVDVEVYFGWSIPHRAVVGSFVGDDSHA